ncbi:DUF2809 domain-containing protein [Microbacterium sp. MYb62]|uniref:ribosomal maturation YjgA family protein n=1 Tax=Microbacterium sp. MYb62 TaxID=1848690 RepID=UPI000CFD3E43|nr:DUF2809 domain-containing protein [Microbacterium sp. MYb62]PRB10422.1 hypothetical protein CQ042_17930 [Microbacterium sp. MYb62]
MTNDAAAKTPRRRVVLSVLAVVTIGVGLVVHRGLPGTIGDIAGDALYAVLVYLLVAVIVPRCSRAAVAAVAFAICTGIELLQMTGLPREWAAAFPPIELVLGSGFDLRDIVVYATAVTAAFLIDHAVALASAGAARRNATGRPPGGERPV